MSETIDKLQLRRCQNNNYKPVHPETDWENIIGKPLTFTPTSHSHNESGELTIYKVSWQMKEYIIDTLDLGGDDAIFLSPKTKVDKERLEEADIFIEVNSSGVVLTCENTPDENISVNYFIVKGSVIEDG